MADPVDLEALDGSGEEALRTHLPPGSQIPHDLACAVCDVLFAYPALREEIVSLRERTKLLTGALRHDAGQVREHLRRVVQTGQVMMKRHHAPIQYEPFSDIGDFAAALAVVPPELLEEPRDA